MDKLELFTNLLNLAAVDEKFMESEIGFLIDRANRWGIPNDEVEVALAGIREAGVQIKIPERHEDKVRLLKEMIRTMAADGEMADQERELCARASALMDFTSGQFKDIVDQVIAEGPRGRD